MPEPIVLKTVAEVNVFTRELRAASNTLALVPTMGFLHDGHLSLMREGKNRADVVATTIFVNPTQFGPKEDLASYPRDLKGDLAKCGEAGASVVWAPDPSEVYPPGFQTWVEVGEVSKGLCGDRRPGHFKGVATVVAKLLALFRPELALFGEKDYQQLQVIHALNRDLNLGVEIVGMPTIREADGLAMSSRNSYLKGDDRQRALALSKGLRDAQALAKQGERDPSKLQAAIRAHLQAAALREDYAEVVDAMSLKPLSALEPGKPARALVAAFVGTTRLIDNMPIELG
jgi:pantoate--beta-alanine ligase